MSQNSAKGKSVAEEGWGGENSVRTLMVISLSIR